MNDCISNNVYLNNAIVSTAEAKLYVYPGKLTIYEAIRILDGCPLFIEDHLNRLQQSAALLHVPLLISIERLQLQIAEFIKHESIDNGNIKLQFTYNDNVSFSLLYQLRHSYPTKQMYTDGVHTKTIQIERNNPNAKNIQSFHQIAQTFILDNAIYEALLVDNDLNITEGSKSNIFFIKDNRIITALASDVLLGITRKYVIKAAELLGLTIEERKIPTNELQDFDAAFISGTSPKILPIYSIDLNVYNTSNIFLQQLMSTYDALIKQYIDKQRIKA
jgi:branched-chain amino acid aminotransferase